MAVDREILFRLATSQAFESAVRATPFGEQLARQAAARYVAGPTQMAALEVAREMHARGAGSSLDLFGEQVTDTAVADQVTAGYLELADQVNTMPGDAWLSVDLSHLGLDVDPVGCADRLAAIAVRLTGGRRIQAGAEDYSRADTVLQCVEAVAGRGLADRLGATAQANFRRTPDDLERLVGSGVYIRLVKGAYVEPDDRALPFGEPTDIAYLRLAHWLADAGAGFALATHDGVLREALLTALGPRPVEQLLGVRPAVIDDLVKRAIPIRVYVPFGDNWFRYWMRRLAESRGTGMV
jgi:proline dehydrogenase